MAEDCRHSVFSNIGCGIMDKKSRRPREQRKRILQGSLHSLQKLLHAHLSKELRKSMKRRAIGIRKGDSVKVMKGKNKGKTGKVAGIERRKGRVIIDTIKRKKADGTEIPLPIRASNLIITELDRSDERRFGIKTKGKKEAGKGEKEKDEKGRGIK